MNLRRTLMAMALILAALNGGSAEGFIPPGFDRGAYDIGMDRLARATEPGAWFAGARLCYEASAARWERLAASLYASEEEARTARAALDAWHVEDREARFAAWLEDRFLGREAARLRAAIDEAVRVANAQVLYETDGQGVALRDLAGRPVYRAVGDEAAEREVWSLGVSRTLSETVATFKARMEALRPELIAFVTGDDRRRLEGIVAQAAEAVGRRVEIELASLASREERLFAARRSSDVHSLRQRNEREAASALADALIRDTASVCERGLASLGTTSGEAEPRLASMSKEELSASGEEWLAAFRHQFDTGLAAWRDAEERLVARRLEWERDAALSLGQGEEAWAEAYRRLAEERRAWEARLSGALREGESAFARAGEALEARIREARAEFERDSAERSTASADTVSAWVDVYRRATYSAAGAEESAAYWLSRLGPSAPKARDAGALSALDAMADRPGLGEERRGDIARARECVEAYQAMRSRAVEARARLVDMLGSELELSSSAGSSPDQSEPSLLDERHAASLRLEVRAGYWRRRVAIATAVRDYAVDLSSGRTTEGQGLLRLTEAREAYALALESYETVHAGLRAEGQALDRAREVMDGAAAALARADEALRDANEAYGVALGALASGADGAFLRGELIARYRELIELEGFTDSDCAAASLAAAELRAGRELWFAREERRLEEALARAIEGGSTEASLASLEAAVLAIDPYPSPGEAGFVPSRYGLDPGEAAARDLRTLEAVRAALSATGGATDEWLSRALAEAASAVALGAEARRRHALLVRQEGLRLLRSGTPAEWYAPASTRPLLSTLRVEAELECRSALEARARLELRVLSVILGVDAEPGAQVPETEEPGSDEAACRALVLLSTVVDVDHASLARGRESLEALLAVIDGYRESDEAIFSRALESLAQGDPRAAAFLRGRGSLVLGGLDVVGVFAEATLQRPASARLEAFERYGPEAPALESWRRQAAFERLDEALSGLGLRLGPEGRLPSVLEASQALAREPAAAAALFEGVGAAASQAPDWVARELLAFRDALVKGTSALLAARGTSPSDLGLELGDASARLAEAMALRDDRAATLRAFHGDGPGPRALCAVLRAGGWSEAERRLLEDEAAALIASDLEGWLLDAPSQGSDGAIDERETALALARSRYAYASERILELASARALELRDARVAIALGTHPELLEGYAREARLSEAWDGMNPSGLIAAAREAALTAAMIESLEALALAELERRGASDRAGLLALTETSAEGEASWLSDYYQAEGEDAGVAMESILALLAGPADAAWSMELARDRVVRLRRAAFMGLEALLADARDRLGLASLVAERLVHLPLEACQEGLFELEEPRLLASAFLDLGSSPLAPEAASYYLAALALSDGDFEAAALGRTEAESARGRRIAEARRQAAGRAGTWSGDGLTWALATTHGDPGKAIALLRVSDGGRHDDVLALERGLGPSRGPDDPLYAWVSRCLTERLGEAEQATMKAGALSAFSEAWRGALESLAGPRHWRQALSDPALAETARTEREASALDESDGSLIATLWPEAASSSAEGLLADATADLAISAHRLEAALSLWGEARTGAGLDAAASPALLAAAYAKARNEARAMGARRESLRAAIARLGAVRAAADGSASALLEASAEARRAARAGYDEALAAYAAAGRGFNAAGQGYDAAAAALASRHEELSEARLALDKEEAITQWAASAYLPAGEGEGLDPSSPYLAPIAELERSSAALRRVEGLLASLERLRAETPSVHGDQAYREAVAKYAEDCRRLALASEARDILAASERRASEAEAAAYRAYQETLYGAAGVPAFASALRYGAYTPPADAEARWRDFLRLGPDGRVGLAYGPGHGLSIIDADLAAKLDAYFGVASVDPGSSGGRAMTPYERDVMAFLSRARSYLSVPGRFELWADARDYLLSRLASSNPRFSGLASAVGKADHLRATVGEERLSGRSATELLDELGGPALARRGEHAWASLGEAERADLEFYIIMTLTGGAESSAKGFSRKNELEEYALIEERIHGAASEADTAAEVFRVSAQANSVIGFLLLFTPGGSGLLALARMQYGLMALAQSEARRLRVLDERFIAPRIGALRAELGAGCAALLSDIGRIGAAERRYAAAAQGLALARGQAAGATDASALSKALALDGRMPQDRIAELVAAYEAMMASGSGGHRSAGEALDALELWGSAKAGESRAALERTYARGASDRGVAERAFEAALDGYIASAQGEEALAGLLEAVFNGDGPTLTYHLGALSTGTAEAAFEGRDDASLGIFAGLVARAQAARARAELSVLEAEWREERRSLGERRSAWLGAAAQALNLGRADFSRGEDLLHSGAAAWKTRFLDEYATKTEAWEARFLDFAEARLSWVLEAHEAAASASTGALLSLVGADAAAAARASDTRGVSPLAARDESASALREALRLSSRRAASSSLPASGALAERPALRSSLGPRKGVWDSGEARAYAAAFARHSTEALADMQAKLLASSTRDSATRALEELAATLRSADEGFSASMDALFDKGGWRRDGEQYVKDVVVHATLGAPYLTERASVGTYRPFAPEPWTAKTDLSEARLAGLDALSLRGLLSSFQEELKARVDRLFGRADERKDAASIASRTRTFYQKKTVYWTEYRTVTRYDDDGTEYQVEVPRRYAEEVDDLDNPITRLLEPGLFGSHLGYDPVLRNGARPGSEAIFVDPGTGELGRLVGAYMLWSLKEAGGWHEATKPVYEKRLWDDRDKTFEAPTLRLLADIGVGIVAGALSGGTALPALLGAAAIGLADDVAFGLLDLSGGHKTLEEAGLAFGAKVGMAGANILGVGVFNGFDGIASGFFAQGLSGGLNGLEGFAATLGTGTLGAAKALTMGGISSAINAIELRYETGTDGIRRAVGLSWSAESMDLGMLASARGAAAGFATTLVSGGLDQGLEGFSGSCYTGGRALSALSGGLAGEAVNLALGGQARLNLLNLGALGLTGVNGVPISGGLLEIRWSQSGLSLGLGSGGADVSPGALVKAASGLEAWGVNVELFASAEEESRRYASVMRTLYSAGGEASDERNLYRRILAGQTDILENPDGNYTAVTEYDEATGKHALVLGRGALRDHSRFGLNIVLAHEAYRNGIDDGQEGQGRETARAVIGHMGVAASLARDYGDSSLSSSQREELDALREHVGGDSTRLALVIGGYDSGSDFWKLLADGRLINDGQRRLLVEVLRDDGAGSSWSEVEGSSLETSIAAALVRYLGEARALTLLGRDPNALDTYDDQTLMDVLDLDEAELKGFRSHPGDAARLMASLNPYERQRLLGEALMKGAGIAWNSKANTWEGEGSGLSLSDLPLPGQAAIRYLGDGRYERFAITSDIERRIGAYEAWRDGKKGDLGKGNTRVTFTKWDIDTGESVATLVAPGVWNSVDNSSGQPDRLGRPIGSDNPYLAPGGALLQGNTLSAGSFSMRWSFNGSASIEEKDLFVIAGARTIAGDTLGLDGRRPGHAYEDRWLFHETEYGSSDGCIVHKSGGKENKEYQRMFADLKAWGLIRGYSIMTDLYDLHASELALRSWKGVSR